MDMVQPPMDKFLAFCEARIFIQRGDLDQAGQTLGRGVEIIEQFKFDALRFQITLVEADMHKARGDYVGETNSLKLALQQIDRSFLAAELYAQYVPRLYAELANAQVFAGDLDGAEESLNRGFRLDPSEPNLWSAKARLQKASGLSQLAAASINYALAIWQNADPQFDEWQEARALASEITGTTN
jgi:tetratricopeptide (TPR) repeat protein